jgi:hypothetical protein
MIQQTAANTVLVGQVQEGNLLSFRKSHAARERDRFPPHGQETAVDRERNVDQDSGREEDRRESLTSRALFGLFLLALFVVGHWFFFWFLQTLAMQLPRFGLHVLSTLVAG